MKDIQYDINKGINKPIEFRGLKAQYIWYLAGGLAGLVIAFAIMYLAGAPVYMSLPVVLAIGSGLFAGVYRLSHRYSEYGLMKAASYRQVPSAIICISRKVFTGLKYKMKCRDNGSNSNHNRRSVGSNSA